MRWWFGRDTGCCAACGADLVRGAGWCGVCGARIAEHEDVADNVPAAEVGRPHDRSRWLAVILLVAFVATALAVGAGRTQPAEVLLGRAGNGANLTSSGLPAEELRLAWSRNLPGDEGRWFDVGTFMAEGDHAWIGDRVVDVATGAVVRISDVSHSDGGRQALQLFGRDLVVLDQLLGTVVERVTLPEDVVTRGMWPVSRHGDTTLLAGDGVVRIVRDDGTVTADLSGWLDHWNTPDAGAEAVALREEMDHHGGASGSLRLVSAIDGTTVLTREVPDEHMMVATVDGDRALLVAQDPRAFASDWEGPGWTFELVDATSGDSLAAGDAESMVPPRIVGRTGDDGLLLALEFEDEVEVWEVGPTSELSHRATVLRRNWPSFGRGGSNITGTATMTDGGLLIELVTSDRVEARTLDGEVVWRAAHDGATAVQADGGVVALLPTPPMEEAVVGPWTVQLLDAQDGTRLGSVDVASSLAARFWGPRPTAVVDGAVSIGHRVVWPRVGPAALSEARWLDLATGETITRTDLFESWTDEFTSVGGDLWLAGLVPDGQDGTWSPVLVDSFVGDTTSRTRSLQVLEDGSFVTHEVALPERARTDASFQPVGGTASHVAVWSESWDDGTAVVATHVVDRVTGDVVAVDGVSGLLLTDDLLVGFERNPEDWAADVALVGHGPADGARHWTGPTLANRQDEVMHDDRLLVVGDQLRRTAVSLEDGTSPWTFDPGELLEPGGVIGPDHVLFVTTTGVVLALDRATGAEAWRRELGVPVTSLAGAGTGAVVATLDGEVVVLDGDGTPVQRIELDEVPLHAVALGDTLVVQFAGRVEGYRPDGAGFTANDEVELP